MDRLLTDELLALLEKARTGNATGDDYSRIAAIINTDQTGELIALADNFLAQENPVSSTHIEPYDYDYWQRAFLQIKETWQQQNIQPAKVRRLSAVRRWWWAAASVILLLSVGTYLLVKTKSPQLIAGSTEILPGKDGAILTLANGSQVLLDSIQNGVVAVQGGTVAKIVKGTLLYEGRGNEVVYNVMSTPKARKFHVILPDGTNAWLNSASSIRYPTTFTGNERRITVTGEVYFEVVSLPAPSNSPGGGGKKMPFIVDVLPSTGGGGPGAEIEVLGTHFNVKAYENDSVINTTLLEGVVRVRRKDLPIATGSVTLHSGQQAQILVGQKKMLMNGAQPKDTTAKKTTGQETQPAVTVINNTDIDKVMAWKNGVFDFNDIAFADAMHQLERWYDIEVVYEKGIPADIELNGKMTKDVTLNEMVTILEKIGVKCKLEGRKLLIES
jgi:ferric-dicitrate binding protein FerR (iron transport regulator)